MLFIAGFHRSGTTIVTKLLATHPQLKVGDHAEITWENLPFYETNRAILKANGGSWRKPPQVKVDVAMQARIVRVLREERAKGVNVLKDPRFCLTAPLWLSTAKAEGIKSKILVVTRNPVDSVRSLRRLYKVEMDEGLALYERYYMNLMREIPLMPVRTVLFEVFMQDPEGAMKPICEWLGLDAGLLNYECVQIKNWRHRGDEHKGPYGMDVRKVSA